MIAFNWKLRFSPGNFGWLVSLNQQPKKGVRVLAGVVDADYQGDIGLPFRSRGKEAYTSGI